MKIYKGTLMAYNATDHTATVRLSGSRKGYLENIPVARNLPDGEMVSGRRLAVLFFEQHSVPEAVVIAVYNEGL